MWQDDFFGQWMNASYPVGQKWIFKGLDTFCRRNKGQQATSIYRISKEYEQPDTNPRVKLWNKSAYNIFGLNCPSVLTQTFDRLCAIIIRYPLKLHFFLPVAWKHCTKYCLKWFHAQYCKDSQIHWIYLLINVLLLLIYRLLRGLSL